MISSLLFQAEVRRSLPSEEQNQTAQLDWYHAVSRLRYLHTAVVLIQQVFAQ